MTLRITGVKAAIGEFNRAMEKRGVYPHIMLDLKTGKVWEVDYRGTMYGEGDGTTVNLSGRMLDHGYYTKLQNDNRVDGMTISMETLRDYAENLCEQYAQEHA